MKVRELTKTCNACPSQWEGILDDGRALYVRFRFGALFAAAAPTLDEAILPAETGEVIFAATVGGAWDGDMETDEMLLRTGLEMAA